MKDLFAIGSGLWSRGFGDWRSSRELALVGMEIRIFRGFAVDFGVCTVACDVGVGGKGFGLRGLSGVNVV